MSETPAVVTALLGKLNMTDVSELWALTATGADADPVARTTAYLAGACALALGNIADEDRIAKQKLARLGELLPAETASFTAGMRGDGTWLVQAAAQYTEALARQQAAIAAFRAAYRPLALLRGLTPEA